MFENRITRRIFGPERDDVTGEWRKLHNDELYVLYCSPNIIWMIKSSMGWAVHVARIGHRRVAYRVLVGMPDGKRPLGRRRRRWQEDSIKWIFKKWGGSGSG